METILLLGSWLVLGFVGLVVIYVVFRIAGVAWFRSRSEHISATGKDAE